MDNLIQIHKPNILGEDARGITAEFSLPRNQSEFVFISRKAGTISGNTYHEGKSPATKPKVFILLTGKIVFSYRKINTVERMSKEIDAPAVIEVSPHVIRIASKC